LRVLLQGSFSFLEFWSFSSRLLPEEMGLKMENGRVEDEY